MWVYALISHRSWVRPVRFFWRRPDRAEVTPTSDFFDRPKSSEVRHPYAVWLGAVARGGGEHPGRLAACVFPPKLASTEVAEPRYGPEATKSVKGKILPLACREISVRS
jgi:hypothetical protein